MKEIVYFESKRFYKGKIYIKYILVLLALLLLSYAIIKISDSTYTFKNIELIIYENFTSLFALISSIFISTAISKEHEDKTMNWYISKKIKIRDVVVGKFIFYFINLSIISITIFLISFFINGRVYGNGLTVLPTLSIITILVSVYFFIISLNIFISATQKNSGICIILSFVVWIILNISSMLKVVGLYIAPFIISSIQYESFYKLLNYGEIPNNFLLIVLLPIVYGLLLLIAAVYMAKKLLNDNTI